MAVTLDSLDDSLLERRKKEIAKLQEENKKLRLDLSQMADKNDEWKTKFTQLLNEHNRLLLENTTLEEKLLHYEHDPIIMEENKNSINISFWDIEKDDYTLFATFYHTNLEKDIEEFCKEFIIELKDAYVVE